MLKSKEVRLKTFLMNPFVKRIGLCINQKLTMVDFRAMGNSDLIGGGGPTSALTEVPVITGNKGNNVSDPQRVQANSMEQTKKSKLSYAPDVDFEANRGSKSKSGMRRVFRAEYNRTNGIDKQCQVLISSDIKV
ncbi:hypothetical protein Tco_0637363 [Tanacetum coccineum]